MLASEHFGITLTNRDDWFDPILDHDTRLGVDPFLIFQDTQANWSDAHDELIGHFNRCFLFVADGQGNPSSLAHKKAVELLRFPEPREFCLGYTRMGTSGSGGGLGSARMIAAAMSTAIARGVEDIRHFEELGILHEKIGMDRISDITLNILKHRFIAYTLEIAERHSLPLDNHPIKAAAYDSNRHRWERLTVAVPTNPITGGPLLFTPRRFLRDLPFINANDWWEWYEAEQLLTDLNYRVMEQVDKAYIVSVARRDPDAVRRWTIEREGERANAYDLDKDRRGVWLWDPAATKFTNSLPLKLPAVSTSAEFFEVIDRLLQQYSLFVEERGGWKILWNDDGTEREEETAQLLFYAMARNYCSANNVVVDREVNLGRGPVDFKFSSGYEHRALLEVKKLHNGKFWNGLRKQLPSYMTSDEARDGWFVAIRYTDSKTSEKRWIELPDEVVKVAQELALDLRLIRIDGRRKLSASKL